MSSVAPNYCYEFAGHEVQDVFGAALEASDETAGRENVARVEGALELLHERKILARRAPDVQLAFEFDWAPQDLRAACGIGSVLLKLRATLLELRKRAARRREQAVTDAAAAENVSDRERMSVGETGCLVEKRGEIGAQAREFQDCSIGARLRGWEFADGSPEMLLAGPIQARE